MSNGRKGLGISQSSKSLLSPCPKMIEAYFTDQLRYNKSSIEDKSNKNQFLVRYQKALSMPHKPEFPELKNVTCLSNIVVDLYTGGIVDAWFKVNRGPAIRGYSECPQIASILWVFQWHVNLVHMSREYIKGGWLERKRLQQELQDMKAKRVIMNKLGTTNFIEKARPEHEPEYYLEKGRE